jgi:hypothetical protein
LSDVEVLDNREVNFCKAHDVCLKILHSGMDILVVFSSGGVGNPIGVVEHDPE